MKLASVCVITWLALPLSVLADQGDQPTTPQVTTPQVTQVDAEVDMDLFDMEDWSEDTDQQQDQGLSSSAVSWWQQHLIAPLRLTLQHEFAGSFADDLDLYNNRSSVRLEYDNYLFNKVYARLDSKYNQYWGSDHRHSAQSREILTREAYLQTSFDDTSIRLGVQMLIWGESEAGAITDVISPRNLSELFYINLEESRLGQPMLNIEQYTDIGDWSVFYIPEPRFNETPQPGTAYYFDPFDDNVQYLDTAIDNDDEYGMSWKQTFGKSDITLMAASLLENNLAMRLEGITSDGRSLISRNKQRFSMLGMTFNYAKGDYLFSGEMASKASRAFNTSSFGLLEKDVVDTAIELEYSLGASDSISVELVNSHVIDWQPEISGVAQNSNSLVLSWYALFLNDDLTVNWLSIFNQPYTSYQHTLYVTYKWNDFISFNLDSYIYDTEDQRNSLYVYRDQKQVVFKMQYQF